MHLVDTIGTVLYSKSLTHLVQPSTAHRQTSHFPFSSDLPANISFTTCVSCTRPSHKWKCTMLFPCGWLILLNMMSSSSLYFFDRWQNFCLNVILLYVVSVLHFSYWLMHWLFPWLDECKWFFYIHITLQMIIQHFSL